MGPLTHPQGQHALERALVEHRSVLRELFERGRSAWPDLELGFETFASDALAHTLARFQDADLPVSTQELEATLRALHAEDLWLASACERGLHGAAEALLERHVARLRPHALGNGASEYEADEIVRELPGELFSPPASGSRGTRLGTYSGAGSLDAWLKVIVIRRLNDRARSRAARPVERASEAGSIEPSFSDRGAGDPLERAATAELRAPLERALADAGELLTDKERLALLYRFREDLSQREIARLLGIGEPRVSRLLDQGLGKLQSRVARALERVSVAGADELEGGLREVVIDALRRGFEPPSNADARSAVR